VGGMSYKSQPQKGQGEPLLTSHWQSGSAQRAMREGQKEKRLRRAESPEKQGCTSEFFGRPQKGLRNGKAQNALLYQLQIFTSRGTGRILPARSRAIQDPRNRKTEKSKKKNGDRETKKRRTFIQKPLRKLDLALRPREKGGGGGADKA